MSAPNLFRQPDSSIRTVSSRRWICINQSDSARGIEALHMTEIMVDRSREITERWKIRQPWSNTIAYLHTLCITIHVYKACRGWSIDISALNPANKSRIFSRIYSNNRFPSCWLCIWCNSSAYAVLLWGWADRIKWWLLRRYVKTRCPNAAFEW